MSTNNLIWLCIFLLFLNGKVYGQSEISGLILNEDQKPVLSASIILKDISGKIISYTFTNDAGIYRLLTTRSGQFILIVSSLSFEHEKVDISLKKNEFKKLNFNLISKVTELKEVIVKANRPIIVKKDTIIFDAKSLLQGNEQVVEDLLKKIPGLNVLTDGTIKIGNQEVEKVMIDGDDFFEKGYRIVTKNMPSYPIDKVELYQNYSNNKHLKGIEYSEKVALNLTLKEDSKHIWFGNATGEYGIISRDRYLLRTNLMNFGKKSKHYFLTNMNTIGDDAIGDINHLIRPFRFNEPASIGDNQSASSILTLNYSLPNLAKRRINLNHDKMLSLNSIYTLSDKIKIKTIGFLNTNKNDFFRNSYQEFMLGNLNFKNNEDFIGRKTQFVGFAKIDLTFDITKSKTIEFTSKINKSTQNDRGDLLFNDDEINELLQTRNHLLDQKIVFTNKLKKNKVFLLSARYIDERTPQNYTISPNIFSDLFLQNTNETNQFSENNMQFAGVEAHLFNRKKNGDLIEIKFGNQLRIDKLNTYFELVENTKLSYPEGYQNKITYASNDVYLSAIYNFKLSKFSIISQSDFHQLTNHLINFDAKRSQHPFYVVPKIGLDWKMNEKNKIVGSYSYNTTNAGVLDVYSGYVQSGFRSIGKGTDQFNQLNSSNAILGYEYGDWGDSFFAKTHILYFKNNDFFSTNSIVAQNYSQSEKIIIKDREFLSISSSVDCYLKPIKSNFKINLGATKTNFKNIVNNSILRDVKKINTDYGFELRSVFSGIFNYHLGSKWNFNQVETIIKNSFTDNLSFLDLSFMFSDKFNMQVQAERYFFGNLAKENNKYYFLDLEARYVVKENKLTFFLSGNNLFNTKTFRNYSISDINISQTEYRLMPRYVLLKMEYRF